MTSSPKYYASNSGRQAWDVVEDFSLNFNLGNAFKYIARAGRKTGSPDEDLSKAIHYIERELTLTEDKAADFRRSYEEAFCNIPDDELESPGDGLIKDVLHETSKLREDMAHQNYSETIGIPRDEIEHPRIQEIAIVRSAAANEIVRSRFEELGPDSVALDSIESTSALEMNEYFLYSGWSYETGHDRCRRAYNLHSITGSSRADLYKYSKELSIEVQISAALAGTDKLYTIEEKLDILNTAIYADDAESIEELISKIKAHAKYQGRSR